MPLNWSTDPQLYDKEPIAYNKWLTANDLLRTSTSGVLRNTDLSFANIYGIMVRKVDFVRKNSRDRIIARFPFLVMNEEISLAIQGKILLISELARDYFYRSINKSITEWKDIIVGYLEKRVLPFPLFRCAQEILPEIQLPIDTNNLLQFQSARGEAFTFPTKISNRLAYLCGICNGDGNLRDYWLIVADETKEHIEFIRGLLKELFSKEGAIMKTGGAWIVKLNLLWCVRLFNFLTNQAIDEPKYDYLGEPVVFQQLGEPYRSLYWRGAFDADGSFKRRMSFSTMSKAYATDFQKFLSDIYISSKVVQTNLQASQVEIPAKYKWQFAEQIGSTHPKKKIDFFNFLSKSIANKEFLGINKQHLTTDNYFDFNLLPKLQVLGLEDFLKSIPFPKSTSDRFRNYENKSITIRKLSEYNLFLVTPYNSVMDILKEYRDIIKFQSSNSTAISLPLKPTSEIELLMSNLIPTVRGATLLDTSEKQRELVRKSFSIPIKNDHLIEHRLVSTFLKYFGLYKITQKVFTKNDRANLQNNWLEKLKK